MDCVGTGPVCEPSLFPVTPGHLSLGHVIGLPTKTTVLWNNLHYFRLNSKIRRSTNEYSKHVNLSCRAPVVAVEDLAPADLLPVDDDEWE